MNFIKLFINKGHRNVVNEIELKHLINIMPYLSKSLFFSFPLYSISLVSLSFILSIYCITSACKTVFYEKSFLILFYLFL